MNYVRWVRGISHRLCCILVYFLLNVWPVFAWAVCLHKCVYVFFSGINMDCTYSILFVLLICLLLIVHLNINRSDSGVPHLVAPLYFTSKSLRKETVAVFARVVVYAETYLRINNVFILTIKLWISSRCTNQGRRNVLGIGGAKNIALSYEPILALLLYTGFYVVIFKLFNFFWLAKYKGGCPPPPPGLFLRPCKYQNQFKTWTFRFNFYLLQDILEALYPELLEKILMKAKYTLQYR